MSCFEKLTHVLWHCQYHIVWVPKYRYRVLTGDVAREVHNCIQVYSSRLGCRVIELNVQPDHVHLLVKVPPKVSISKLLGVVKGKTALRKTALRIFTKFPYLRNKPYWGNHFWVKQQPIFGKSSILFLALRRFIWISVWNPPGWQSCRS